MNLQTRFVRLPLALLVALFLGSCAHAPDRHAAQSDHASDERSLDKWRGQPHVVAERREGRAKTTIGVSARKIAPVTEKSVVEAFARERPIVAIPMVQDRDKPGSANEEPGSTNPFGAQLFRRLQMQDEKGEIPPDGLEKARQHVTLMKTAQKARLEALRKSGKAPEPGAQAAGIEPNSWTWLGPGNVGGRIRSIVIHPTNTNNMWVGSVSGGIWRTTNAGASWFPVNDFMASLAVSTMVMHPTNSNIMYAGTGESFAGDGIQGAGVFKSADGGVTWNHLSATAYNNGISPAPNPDFFFVNRLAISPNGNTLAAATNSGVWESTDAGVSWTQRTFVRALDIDFHPTDSTQAIVGEVGAAQFRTVSPNGLVTWTAATFNSVINGARVEVAYAPSDGGIVYASVDRNMGEFYRSDSGGQFTRRNATISPADQNLSLMGTQGGYDNIVWVNPQNPNFVMVGGVFLFRSRDGGNTFDGMGDSATNRPHTDQHMIVAHPDFNNNNTVFIGNDGGIFRFADVNVARLDSPAGFTELNNNLGITQFYGAAGNPATGVIVGGTQDNGTPRFSGNTGVANYTETWTDMTGGDGGYCASDPTDGNYFYGENENLKVRRSTNGGMSSTLINNGIADIGGNSNFIAPIVLDSNNPNTLLAGGLSLWRSQNVKAATPTWAAIKGPQGNAVTDRISAIALSPISSALILVGHNGGDIYRTINGLLGDAQVLPSWTKIDTAALPNGRMVTRLVIDPNHSTNWYYATFGGFSPDNVWRSTDNGATWVDVSGSGATGLPSVPARTLVYHPTDPNLLYVGTEIGIFTSENAGATWEPSQDGPANVSVDELFWMGGNLIAATHGRGIYRASSGIYVDKNAGIFQVGTFELPFKTVTQGKNAATKYQPVWIKTGSYNETMTIDNPNGLELRSLGGPVTIGPP